MHLKIKKKSIRNRKLRNQKLSKWKETGEVYYNFIINDELYCLSINKNLC